MGRKPSTPLSNIATSSTPNNLNWGNAKHACLDRKNLTKPPLPAEIMHDLERWSEDEVSVREKGKTSPQMPKKLQKANSPTQQKTGAGPKVIELAKDKLNVRHKGIQRTIDAHTKKRIEQVARKTIRIATKVKNPKTFEQRYKTVDGKILTYTPHTAWVQTFGKQPRLLRNSGAAFVPSPLIYGPCRPSRFSDYVAYKSARRSGPCLRFLDIENPNAPQHAMFKEDKTSGLPVNQTKKQLRQQTSSPTKRNAKATGKRTGGRPPTKPQTRGMTLQTDVTVEKGKRALEKSESRHSDDNQSTTSSEDVAPSPKRQNQKGTPPTSEPQRKSTRNRQSALSNAFGNAIPINTITELESNEKPKEIRLETDSPPEQQKLENPSLKTLIQEMGFSNKTPQYQACSKFIEAISPKHGNKQTEVVDLTSPTEEDMAENNNDILLIKDIDKKKKPITLKCRTMRNTISKKGNRQRSK